MKICANFYFFGKSRAPSFFGQPLPHLIFRFSSRCENNVLQIKDHFSHPKEIDDNSFIWY